MSLEYLMVDGVNDTETALEALIAFTRESYVPCELESRSTRSHIHVLSQAPKT